ERTRIAAGYTERLRDLVDTPSVDEGDVQGWQAYVIQVDDAATVIAGLRERGIEAQVGTYALHQLAAYRDQGDFPGASRVFDRAVDAPCARCQREVPMLAELERQVRAVGGPLEGGRRLRRRAPLVVRDQQLAKSGTQLVDALELGVGRLRLAVQPALAEPALE